MKVGILCYVLLMAGSACCSPVEANSISLPSWIPDIDINAIDIPEWILDLIGRLPDSIQDFIDRLPEIIAAIPDILDKLPEIVAGIIDKIPELIPIIVDKIPEIIAQIPAAIDKIREVILLIIEKLPEYIPIILDRIQEVIAAFPEIKEKIKEILADLDLPDWIPSLPDKPEWWPELPSLPEYNKPVPGTPTSIEEYPGIVQIEVGAGPIWVQGCVGSILTSLHVLSAARCFSGASYDGRFRRVVAGASSRFADGFIVQVDRVSNHPSFSTEGVQNDISVVRLATGLSFGSTIQQTPIVPQDFTLPTGISVVNVGWGSTAQGKLIADRDLYEIELVTIDQTECSNRWSKIPVFPVGENTMCIGHPNTSGRNGDIRDLGSPSFYQGILVGITSVGVHVGNQYFPVITTAVGPYTNWILSAAN